MYSKIQSWSDKLPPIKCSRAPPSLPLLPSTVSLSELCFDFGVLGGSWKELLNIWLTVAKNTFVGWALNFRVWMLMKGAVTECEDFTGRMHMYQSQVLAVRPQVYHYLVNKRFNCFSFFFQLLWHTGYTLILTIRTREEFVNHSPAARDLRILLVFSQHPAWFFSL